MNPDPRPLPLPLRHPVATAWYVLIATGWVVFVPYTLATSLSGLVLLAVLATVVLVTTAGMIWVVVQYARRGIGWFSWDQRLKPGIRAVAAAARLKPHRTPLLDRDTDHVLYVRHYRGLGWDVRRSPAEDADQAFGDLEAGRPVAIVPFREFLIGRWSAIASDQASPIRLADDGYAPAAPPPSTWATLRGWPTHLRLGTLSTTTEELLELAEQLQRAEPIAGESSEDG